MIGEFSSAQLLSDCQRLVIVYAPQHISIVDDLTIQQLLDLLAEHVHERQHELGELAKKTRAHAPIHGFQYEFLAVYVWLVSNRLLHDNALVCNAIADYVLATYDGQSVAAAIKCSWIDDVITAVDEISVLTYMRTQQLHRLCNSFDDIGTIEQQLALLNKKYEWASTQQSTRSNK